MKLLLAIAVATPAALVAQDLPTTQIEDHSQVIRQDGLTRTLLWQKPSRSNALGIGAMAACANEGRAAASLEPGDARVRRLSRLCAQAGY